MDMTTAVCSVGLVVNDEEVSGPGWVCQFIQTHLLAATARLSRFGLQLRWAGTMRMHFISIFSCVAAGRPLTLQVSFDELHSALGHVQVHKL